MIDKSSNIKFALANLKDGIDRNVALAVVNSAKKELSKYYESVSFGTHTDVDLSNKSTPPQLSLMMYKDSLVLCVDGKMIQGQRDLKINSAVNDLVSIDINIIVTKGMIPINEIKD